MQTKLDSISKGSYSMRNGMSLMLKLFIIHFDKKYVLLYLQMYTGI